MFPITFSSFGDIVAAAQLAVAIANALSESSGSSYEYQCLIEELRSFSRALNAAHGVVQNITLSRDVLNGIDAEVTVTRSIMTKFEDKIQGYKKALDRGGSGSSWRKIGWGLFKKQEIVELRTKLAAHRQNIILLLTLGNTLSDGVVQEFLNEARQNHMSIKVKLNEIYTAIQQPSPSIGYSRHNTVQLEDVLGSTMILPMELCSTWAKFDSVIKTRFRGRAGQQYVEGGAYEISAEGKGTINSREWELLVRRGMVLEMSIVMEGSGAQSRPCPRCRAPSRTVKIGDWDECQYCNGRYQVVFADLSPTEIFSPIHDQDVSQLSPEAAMSLLTEISLFRRIQVTCCAPDLFKSMRALYESMCAIKRLAEMDEVHS
ncbi:hypothetical protein JAAARDRAFT_211010 [Jaapia argillacea MUCL 33604]|uniref:Ubiquitin-like domain-containing protein n=1 Tax=Jaapia argillacea MUCL 33604 TaxID=933084 RepID=A0A067P9X1_9AGAM|nr:hypothetical protein JAAARDRAFT_211010 [Jaapia argillacea MUCL 33604]